MRFCVVDVLKGVSCTPWIRASRVLFLSFAFFSADFRYYALVGCRGRCGDIACAGCS